MGNIERRIGKLEEHREVLDPGFCRMRFIIKPSCGREPTDEEKDVAEKKFLDEHPGARSCIILDFQHLHDEEKVYGKH